MVMGEEFLIQILLSVYLISRAILEKILFHSQL